MMLGWGDGVGGVGVSSGNLMVDSVIVGICIGIVKEKDGTSVVIVSEILDSFGRGVFMFREEPSQ